MPVISKSLTDALKQILQSLQIPFLFPAVVFVLATFLLYPGEIEVDDATLTIGGIMASVMLSYLLYACNIPIIRLAEGYTMEHSWFFRLTHWFENRRYENLKERIKECDTAIAELTQLQDELSLCNLLTDDLEQMLETMCSKWTNKKRPLQEWMELRFPVTLDKPLPTAMGNTIAAFEDYPWARYCIDAVHLWPRLLPILEQKKFISFVQSEKTIFDFLLNLGFVSLGICLELLLLFALFRPLGIYLGGTVGLLILAYVLYRAAIVAAVHWGGMVRVAFDLYRDDLRQALHLQEIPDKALDKERTLWATISSFIVFGNDDDFEGFVYSKPQKGKEEPSCAASG